MPKLYTIYKKYEKKMKYATYIPPEKYEEIFTFFKKCDKIHDYSFFLVSKYKYFLKEGTFVNFDSGIIIIKDARKNQTVYEYIKNHYLFIENRMSMVKENQLEKYAPIVIDLTEDGQERKKERKKGKNSLRNTFESILDTIEETEEIDEDA